jgi:hypothetical protein
MKKIQLGSEFKLFILNGERFLKSLNKAYRNVSLKGKEDFYGEEISVKEFEALSPPKMEKSYISPFTNNRLTPASNQRVPGY